MNRLEYSRPTTSRHWGWCSEKCHTIAKLYSNKLKETKVDVLTLQECTILGKQQRVNLHYEFCAGNKRLYPKTKVYRRIYDERKRRFWYKVEVRLKLIWYQTSDLLSSNRIQIYKCHITFLSF